MKLEPMIRAKAKANQQVRKGGQFGTTSQETAKLSPVDAREEAGEVFGDSKNAGGL